MMSDSMPPGPAPPRIFTPEYYARMRELEDTSWWNEGMRDIAAMLLRRAHLPDSGVLLDAGCGSGQTMAWFLAHHSKWRAVGIDVAADGLSAATTSGLPVSRASALRLPFDDNTLTAVLSLDVLQHLPLDGGDAVALTEFARVLAPGGILLIRTNAQSFPRTADDRQYSFRKYEPAALRRRILAAGFGIEILGRCNALLGLAEIPRELDAARRQPHDYHGILGEPVKRTSFAHRLKRDWVRLEGRAMIAGVPLPLGRTLFALARVRK